MSEEREDHELRDDRPRTEPAREPEPTFGMHSVPRRTMRVEYIDEDGRAHDKREAALISSIRIVITRFFMHWWNDTDHLKVGKLVDLVMKHRTHVIAMLTPPRDAVSDQHRAMTWANSHGISEAIAADRLKDVMNPPMRIPTKLARSDDPPEEVAVEDDDPDDRWYTKEDMIGAFVAGIEQGRAIPPIEDAKRSDH